MGRGGGGKKKCPEGAIRINYLHQARHHVIQNIGEHVGRVIMANLGQNMVGMDTKCQIRRSMEIKQKLCKVLNH